MDETTDRNCVFCRIARGEVPATQLHAGSDFVAFKDLNPQAPTHVLVIPRRHIPSADHLGPDDESLIGSLVLGARTVARELGLARSGYRLVVNVGADGGQSVDHLHLHLLGGRALGWPPG